MFQPIGKNFNSDIGYMNTRDQDADVNKQMEKISQMRQNETDLARQRPPTPDFLKAQKTQREPQNYDNVNYSNNNTNNLG